MGGRIKRDGSYDERNRYYEKRDYSFRSTTFFVSYVTLNATTVTKSATIHYGTSNPIIWETVKRPPSPEYPRPCPSWRVCCPQTDK